MNARTFVVALMVVSAFACEEDDEGGNRTREQFCRDWAEAACSEETVSACQASDVEDCRQTQEDFCRTLVPSRTFSDAQGQVCIDAVKAAYADGDLEGGELATVLRLGAPCDKIIRGTQGRGDECESTEECDGPAGFVCVRHADEEEGTCQEPEEVGAGRDCSAQQSVCEEGFYCNGDNCVEAKDAGEACTIQEECGDDGFCNADGECEERFEVNDACMADNECLEGVCFEFEGESTCTDRIRLGRSEPICEDLK